MLECILVKVWETLACLQSAFAPIVNLEVKILWGCYLIVNPELYLLWLRLLCSDFSLFLIPLAFQLPENPQISSPSEWPFFCFLAWLWTHSFSYVFSLISVEIILEEEERHPLAIYFRLLNFTFQGAQGVWSSMWEIQGKIHGNALKFLIL